MEHSEIHTRINISDYDAIVSLGNKCPTAMILRDLGLYKESYPFDYVPTTPKLILKYMKNQLEFYPGKSEIRTEDGVWFGHFDLEKGYYTTLETFKRRFDRLFQLLLEKKRILFVYTSEADVYNEMNNRYNDNYQDLKEFVEYLKETYNYSDFLVLAIHTNKTFVNEPNFVHYTINVEDQFLSDNTETHIPSVTGRYRDLIKLLFQKIFL